MECIFGILKKRWKVLAYGVCFLGLPTVEKIFVVCRMLHIFLLSEMESKESDVCIGLGKPFPRDGIQLRGGPERSFPWKYDNRVLAHLWSQRRDCLADHIHYCPQIAKNARRRLFSKCS